MLAVPSLIAATAPNPVAEPLQIIYHDRGFGSSLATCLETGDLLARRHFNPRTQS
jgi:hypothetical protein